MGSPHPHFRQPALGCIDGRFLQFTADWEIVVESDKYFLNSENTYYSVVLVLHGIIRYYSFENKKERMADMARSALLRRRVRKLAPLALDKF